MMKLNRIALDVIRERSRLSKSDLASLAGITPSTYSDLISGRRGASDDLIARLADALAIPVPAIAATIERSEQVA